MIRRICYFFWKRRAEKAFRDGQTAVCAGCKDPIVPGDFVARCWLPNDPTERLVHAGFHFSLSKIDAYCTSGALGSAIWNGKEVVGIGESLAAKAIRTGEVQVR